MSEEVKITTLSISASPHIREGESVGAVMWTVILALAPVGLFSVYLFGWYAGVVILTTVASCVFFEAAWQRVSRKAITVADGSAVVSGLLLAYVMPPNSPIYVLVVASAVAMFIGKHLFGGLGCNIWNPALVGRAFVQIAYPGAVTLSAWPIVKGHGLARVFEDIRNVAPAGADASAYDAISRATPLAGDSLASLAPDASGSVHAAYPHLWDLFVGTIPGCLGETSALLILIGGMFLISRGHINWKVPAVFLGTLFLFALFAPTSRIPGSHVPGGLPQYAGAPGWWYFPLYEVLAGGAMLGAFFMATDMVTTPMTSGGQVIFALGCGVITGAIRLVGYGFPEGVCYSILLMNTAVPVIDRHTKQKKYGAIKAVAK